MIKVALLTALGASVLVSVSEVFWTYLLHVIDEQRRTELPVSVFGLFRFIAAALVTDVTLALAAAVILVVLLWLLTRFTPVRRTSPRLRTLIRALILGVASCYLYLGWMGLFILPAGDRATLEYRLILGIGAALILLLSLVTGAVLSRLQRRGRRAAPLVAWCGAVAVLLLFTAGAFTTYDGPPSRQITATIADDDPHPNVLLVTIDTLRVDFLSCYGHPWIETPVTDALAAEGVLFETAISQAPSTTPSHCSILTSLYPFDHDAENGSPMRAGLVTLTEVLRANGYETSAFTSATTTRSINTGLQHGFDRYVDSLVTWSTLFSADEFQHLLLFYVAGINQGSQIPGNVVTDRALDWLEHRSNKPFFTWLHYFDPHTPYGSPAPVHGMYAGKAGSERPMARERELYAEDVTFTDLQLGRFVDALKRKGLFDNTIIVVVSDHGEAFGETHDDLIERGHGHFLYDVTQHVPLLIKPAGAARPGRRVAEQVSLVDIAPTVLSLLRIKIPEEFVGSPLDELLDGRPFSHAGRDAYSFNITAVGSLYMQQLAVRSPQWKYIVIPSMKRSELYNLIEDPTERTSVAEANRDVVKQRHARVIPFWDAASDTGERHGGQRLAPALIQQLQALGYVGGDDEKDETPPGGKKSTP